MVSNENIADDLNRCLPERTPAKTWLEKHLLEKKEAAQEISATLMKHYWLCLLQNPPSASKCPPISRRASRPPDSCSPLALLRNLHASSSCSHGMSCARIIFNFKDFDSLLPSSISEEAMYECTCSSPCERTSPRCGSQESSTWQ